MNVLLVDTSSWIEYFRGKEIMSIDSSLKEGRVILSPIVAAELLSGSIAGDKRKRLIEFLQDLPLVNSDLSHWIAVGELRSRLLKGGYAISTPDAHIAQSCLDLDCYLHTTDRIFNKISKRIGLKLLD